MKKKAANFILASVMVMSFAAAAIPANAEEEKDYGVLVRVNFDGKDQQDGYQYGTNKGGASEITAIEDGNLVVNGKNFVGDDNFPMIRIKDWSHYGSWSSLSGNAISVGDYEKVTIRTRFKIDGESIVPLSSVAEIFRMVDGHVNSSVVIFAKEGKLAFGISGNTPSVDKALKVTDYDLYKGTWYTMEVYCQNAKWYVNIIPDDGEAYYGTDAITTGFKNSDEIGEIHWWRNQYFSGLIDYVEVVNEGFRIKNVSIADGEEDVPAYTDYTVKFSDEIVEDTMKAEVKDSQGNLVPTEITMPTADKAKIEFAAGLKYDEEYTVTIPTTVKTTGGKSLKKAESFTFVTEEAPYSVGDFTYSAKTNEMDVSLKVKNKSGLEKNINVLLVSYDDDGRIYAIKSEKITIDEKFSGTKTVSVKTAQSTPKKENVKAYIWDGLEFVE